MVDRLAGVAGLRRALQGCALAEIVAHYADTAGETADYPRAAGLPLSQPTSSTPSTLDKPRRPVQSANRSPAICWRDRRRRPANASRSPPASSPCARRFRLRPAELPPGYTIEDTIDTTARPSSASPSPAGARCHDHKFDPISQVDHYARFTASSIAYKEISLSSAPRSCKATERLSQSCRDRTSPSTRSARGRRTTFRSKSAAIRRLPAQKRTAAATEVLGGHYRCPADLQGQRTDCSWPNG